MRIRVNTKSAYVLGLAAALAAAPCAPATAQTVVANHEHLSASRPEAWAMGHAGAATLFLGTSTPRETDPGTFTLGAELASIPHIDRADTRVGFDGTKFEDLNKTPVFGRARLGVGLPGGFTLELAYTPPVSINGARPDGIYGLALQRPLAEGRHWRLGARVFGQTADIRGDITCPADLSAEPVGGPGNPDGCRAPSDDRVGLDHYGAEIGVAFPLRNGSLEPFVSVAVSRLHARVQVNARVFEVLDHSTRTTNVTLRTLRTGLAWRASRDWLLSASADYTPLDVRRPPDREFDNDPFWSLRLMAEYRF